MVEVDGFYLGGIPDKLACYLILACGERDRIEAVGIGSRSFSLELFDRYCGSDQVFTGF